MPTSLPPRMPAKDHWVVEKKIPIATIAGFFVAVFVQTFGLGYWISDIQNRVRTLETSDKGQSDLLTERIKLNDARWEAAKQREDVQRELFTRREIDSNTRVTKLETSFGFILESLSRIEKKIEPTK